MVKVDGAGHPRPSTSTTITQPSSSTPPAKKEGASPSLPTQAASHQRSIPAASPIQVPPVSRSSAIRDSLPRLFIPSPSPSPSLALAIAASSAAAGTLADVSLAASSKTFLSGLGDQRSLRHHHHPLTPISPSPSSSSTSSATKNKLRAVIFNRSMSMPHGSAPKINGSAKNNANIHHFDGLAAASLAHAGDSSPGFLISSPSVSSLDADRRDPASPSPQTMTDQEHQVVESLLSLRSAASPASSPSPSSFSGKTAGRRKRKLAPAPTGPPMTTSMTASRQQRLLYVPSATFPLPAASFSFPLAPSGASSSTPSTPSSLPATPPFPPALSPNAAPLAVNARSISPQDRHLAESLLSLSKGVPPTSRVSSAGVATDAEEYQAMDLSTHSDLSANGTK